MNNSLVLLRHGESQWNLENRFTGWTDVDLTEKGEKEAKAAGKLLKEKSFTFDLIFTSVLIRAINTMKLCIKEMEIMNLPIEYDWRLNERHYGALQGLNKNETAKKYGNNQVLIWRRSYDVSPPKLEINDKRHPQFDEKYKNLDLSLLPTGECLKDTVTRVLSVWDEKIFPMIKLGKKILIVAHGNSLRALIKYLDTISDLEIIKLNVPTGIPLVYELDNNFNANKNYYLGNYDIKSKINEIKAQGNT